MWYTQYPWNVVLDYTLIAVAAYLMGSLNGAIITSKNFYKKDIREFGSGNAGLTNFYRVFGKFGLALVIAIDVLKAAVPVVFAGWLFRGTGRMVEACAFAGFFVMLGHSYPVYYKFKGGKTVMAAGTVVWFVDWRIGIIVWATFLLGVLLTRYVSLGSVAAGILYPAMTAVFGISNGYGVLIMVTLSGALLIYRHKENIKRIIKGTESKIKL